MTLPPSLVGRHHVTRLTIAPWPSLPGAETHAIADVLDPPRDGFVYRP